MRRSISTIAILLIFAGSCELAQADSWNAEFTGSFKSIGEYESLRQDNIYPYNDLPFTEQRLWLQGDVSNSWLRLEVANQLSYFYQRQDIPVIPVPSYLAPIPSNYVNSAWNTTYTIVNDNRNTLIDRIDRAYAQIDLKPVEIRVGKQVMAEGVGHIFQAVSQVPRYPFVFVDPEYPMTVDAAVVSWEGPMLVEAKYLPKVPGETRDDFHIRAKGSKNGYDFAMTAGRSDDKIYIGLETAGNLGDSLLRAELVGYDWYGKDYVQGLVGFDRVLSSVLSTQFEFFYNGFGQLGNYVLAPLPHLSTPYQGRWYGGMMVTYDITARLKSNLVAIINCQDPSGLLSLNFTFSMWQNIDLVVGQFVSVGGPQSEFGGKFPYPLAPAVDYGIPDLTYAAVKWYF